MTKISVLGSNSFSGSHFVDYVLSNSNWEVIGISRSPEYAEIFLPYLYKKKKSNRFNFYQMDINTDLDKIIELFNSEKPEIIVNFVAQGESGNSWKYPEDYFRTNCMGIMKLVNQLKNFDYIKKYIHISTPEVYGSTTGCMVETPNYYNPSNPYAASKAAMDLFLFSLVKNFNFPLFMTRSSNVYGMHQQLYKIIPRSIIYLKIGKKINLHNEGKTIRSFIHIKDISDGINKIIRFGKKGNLYHFASENIMTISEVVQKICKIMDYDFKNSVIFTSERNEQDSIYDLDWTKAKNELSWIPKVSFEDGIKETVKWIDENWEEIKAYPLIYLHKK